MDVMIDRARESEIKAAIREYLSMVIPRSVQVDDDSRIIDEALIDSLGLVSLISFIEERFHLELPDSEFDAENFQTITSMVNLVQKYMRGN